MRCFAPEGAVLVGLAGGCAETAGRSSGAAIAFCAVGEWGSSVVGGTRGSKVPVA